MTPAKQTRGVYPAHSVKAKITAGQDAGLVGWVRYIDDHYVWVSIGGVPAPYRPHAVELMEAV